MTPLIIILIVIIFLEAYIIVSTNGIDTFRASRRFDEFLERTSETVKVAEDAVKQLMDCVETKDNYLLSSYDTMRTLFETLIEKNKWMIGILKFAKEEYKENIRGLEKDNEAYSEAIDTINEFLSKYRKKDS